MASERWCRIEEVFSQAVALPPADREGLLARACGEDRTLRQEVESLLSADDEAAGFLIEREPGSLVGLKIGRYRIESKLGQGGMSTVYLAVRADDTYQQKVAVKVLGYGLERPDLVARFLAERQILASLDHPGIARLLDGGTMENGHPYLVMEHVDGIPLDRYCDGQRLSVEARIALFRQVCASVEYAHQNLVVHRDIKPSNILVGADGVPRLLDFGIAKLLEGAQVPGAMEATRTGQRLMTPQYASPEQVEGGPITTATDVYSLGVLLYVLLTGRFPYRLQANRPDSVERAVLEQVPERPSTAVNASDGLGTGGSTLQAIAGARGLRPLQLRRKLRGDLDTILLMALRKEPQRRYPSVGLFSEDLRRYGAGLPVMARPDTAGYRLRRFVARHTVAVGAAATVLAVVLGLSATMTFQAVRLVRQRDEIQRERDKALEVQAFLEEVFSGSDPGETQGETVTAREILDKGAARVMAKLERQPDTQSALALAIGKVYLSLGLHEQARPLLAQSLRQREQLRGERHADVADSLMALSVLDQNLGDFAAAETRQRRALAIQRQALPTGDVRIGDTLTDLGVTLLSLARYEDAEAIVREALAIHRRSAASGEGVAYDLNNLGSVLRRSGRLAEATATYREALAVARRTFGPAHPQLTRTINNLAVVLVDAGHLEGAEPLQREALEMTRKLYGNEHPDVALQLANLATLLGARGDADAWLAMARQSLQMRRKLFGPDHEQVAMSLLNVGNALEQKREFDAARACYEDALRIQRSVYGDAHPRVAQALGDLAELFLTTGDLARAEPLAREALAVRRETLSARHADLGRSLTTLGSIRLAAGSAAEAEPLLRDGLGILRGALPAGHWRIGEGESRLGGCLAALGRRAEAEPLLMEGYQLVLRGRGLSSLRTQAALDRLQRFRNG